MQKFLKSQKFTITLIALILIFLGAALSGAWLGFSAIYTTFVGGILGALGLYLTGNVTNDLIATSHKAKVDIAVIKKKEDTD